MFKTKKYCKKRAINYLKRQHNNTRNDLLFKVTKPGEEDAEKKERESYFYYRCYEEKRSKV